jgi:hypothetical protein
VTRRAWTSAARRLSGDRRRPTGTREKISVDGGARNAAARSHSPAHGGVDGGVNGFGHGGDGSDRAMAASDSGGRDGEAKRRVQAAARVGAFGQRRGTARQAMRSGSGCLNGAVGTAFKPPGAFGHRRPRQPIGRGAARHCR